MLRILRSVKALERYHPCKSGFNSCAQDLARQEPIGGGNKVPESRLGASKANADRITFLLVHNATVSLTSMTRAWSKPIRALLNSGRLESGKVFSLVQFASHRTRLQPALFSNWFCGSFHSCLGRHPSRGYSTYMISGFRSFRETMPHCTW
jgi:hypothetical protein